MLDDITVLLSHVPISAEQVVYSDEVRVQNALGKPTKKARELAFRHMATLYALSPEVPLFRAFRRLWASDEDARPVLALTIALARDPLLLGTQDFMQGKQPGEVVSRVSLEALLASQNQDRFSPASLKSFAQNVNGSWTSAGFLTGRALKHRSEPVVTPANAAFCLFLGYLEGASGQRLFTTPWMRLLGQSQERLEELANSAYHRGMLVFMNAGGVKEVRFPGYLTPEEERIRQEVLHVV